jgi:hypothetical protein
VDPTRACPGVGSGTSSGITGKAEARKAKYKQDDRRGEGVDQFIAGAIVR